MTLEEGIRAGVKDCVMNMKSYRSVFTGLSSSQFVAIADFAFIFLTEISCYFIFSSLPSSFRKQKQNLVLIISAFS